MGGSREQVDDAQLNMIQIGGTAFALLVIVWGVTWFADQRGLRVALHAIWLNVPGWLVFAMFIAGLLGLIGELSYLLVAFTDFPIADWRNHAALACLVLSSIAFAVLFAVDNVSQGRDPYPKERW